MSIGDWSARQGAQSTFGSQDISKFQLFSISVVRSRPKAWANAGHPRSSWRRAIEMAGASSLAEAVANALPARAPGVPAWPSSLPLSVLISAIRGFK
jgi:hypothetical protein